MTRQRLRDIPTVSPRWPRLELQPTVDRFMAVRLLIDVGLLYQDLAAAGEIPAGSPLPPMLPIVLDIGF